jgi:hypothetical protein
MATRTMAKWPCTNILSQPRRTKEQRWKTKSDVKEKDRFHVFTKVNRGFHQLKRKTWGKNTLKGNKSNENEILFSTTPLCWRQTYVCGKSLATLMKLVGLLPHTAENKAQRHSSDL